MKKKSTYSKLFPQYSQTIAITKGERYIRFGFSSVCRLPELGADDLGKRLDSFLHRPGAIGVTTAVDGTGLEEPAC